MAGSVATLCGAIGYQRLPKSGGEEFLAMDSDLQDLAQERINIKDEIDDPFIGSSFKPCLVNKSDKNIFVKWD